MSYFIEKTKHLYTIRYNLGLSKTYWCEIMKLSARNQLNGKITNVEKGAVMSNVKIEISEPGVITAVITKESAEKLGLSEGDDVTAIIKSTEVIIGK